MDTNSALGKLFPRGDSNKSDHDKLQWDKLPWEEVEKIVEVMMYGANKYVMDSWKSVASERYEAAMIRHYVSWKKGEKIDKESGLSHLAHMACNLMFVMWLEEHKNG